MVLLASRNDYKVYLWVRLLDSRFVFLTIVDLSAKLVEDASMTARSCCYQLWSSLLPLSGVDGDALSYFEDRIGVVDSM